MVLTRANVEADLIDRTGAFLTVVGKDGTTVDGTNVNLNFPIGYGIQKAGGSVTNVALVTDTDIQSVDTSRQLEMIDIAEYRTLESVAGNFTKPNTKVGPRDEEWGDLYEQLLESMKTKLKKLQDTYGFGAQSLEGGIIQLDFAEHDIDNVDELGW
jgi:hypothetical protein